VVEPRGAEGVPEPRRQPFVLAEDDAFEDRSALAGQPGREGPREPGPDPVGVTADPSPVADDLPIRAGDDHVDAAPAEPRALVEAVRGRTRALQPRLELEVAPWGGERPTGLEQDRLADCERASPEPCAGDAQVEPGAARVPAGDDDPRRRSLTDVRHEDAGIERVEPRGAPPPAGDEQGERDQGDPNARILGKRSGGRGPGRENDHQGRRRRPHRVRRRETKTDRAREHVRVRGQEAGVHGTTSPRSCSTRVADREPRRSSSTERNARGQYGSRGSSPPSLRADAGKRVELLGGRRS
jgi:hypothetical protein